MRLAFSRHAEGRMLRDAITTAEVEEVISHPTSTSRAGVGERLIARRVHAHTMVTVLYEQHPQGPMVVSCWRART